MAAHDGRPVHLYTICWNDAAMLPFFFRHYDPWVDHYILYDDGSTDGTLGILAAHPRATVGRFQRVMPDSFVGSALLHHEQMWHRSRGQTAWVVLTAVDEHLWHPDMPGYLARCGAAGVTAIPALGFQMVSETFPAADETLAETRRLGAPYDMMNKLSIFDPDALAETRYISGRHRAAPTGRVVYPAADEVLNLHYKYLDRDRVAERHRLLDTGLRPLDRAEKVGLQYQWSRAELDADWEAFAARAGDYRTAPIGPATHPDRWWRSAAA
jgi:hypothetical protein